MNTINTKLHIHKALYQRTHTCSSTTEKRKHVKNGDMKQNDKRGTNTKNKKYKRGNIEAKH